MIVIIIIIIITCFLSLSSLIPLFVLKKTETTTIDTVGGGTNDGKPFTQDCPEHTHVTTISGTSNKYLNSLSLTCSDDSTTETIGNPAGTPFSLSYPDGLSSVEIRAGDLIDGIDIAGGKGGAKYPVACESGKITGLHGSANSKSHVDKLGVTCGKTTNLLGF